MKTRIDQPNLAVIIVVGGIILLLISACANTQPGVEACLEGHRYGFLGGLWHGFIAPFSFIGSLFSDNIAVWAVNNTGGWYTFGFILGIGGLCGGASSARRSGH